jgi:6-phosphogluconolactonase
MPTILPFTPTAVAEALSTALDRAAAANGRATLAIPGGRSPGPVLTALAGMIDPFVRERLHLLWLDERAVPQGHPDRNDAPTLAAWRAGGPLPAHVHPMPAEDGDLDLAAERYERVLAEATGGRGIDACLVGIGEDGHCASLFPGHPALAEVAPVLAITDSPKPPPRRLTVGMSLLHQARLLVGLVLGAAKGEVLRRALVGPDRAIPISLLPMPRCVWYLDDAAALAYRGG